MKKIRKISDKLLVSAAALAMADAAFAQSGGKEFNFNTMATQAQSELKNVIDPIINIVSYLVLLVGVVMLVWNFIKRSKNDGQGNDALVSWGFSLVFVFVAIQVIKALVRALS